MVGEVVQQLGLSEPLARLRVEYLLDCPHRGSINISLIFELSSDSIAFFEVVDYDSLIEI